jgi:hypothetical protein
MAHYLVCLPFASETKAQQVLGELPYGGQVLEDQCSFYDTYGVGRFDRQGEKKLHRAAYALAYVSEDGRNLVKVDVAESAEDAKKTALAWLQDNRGTPREITVISEQGIYTLKDFR